MKVKVQDRKRWVKIARVVALAKKAKGLTDDEADVVAGCLVALNETPESVLELVALMQIYWQDEVGPLELSKDQRQNWLQLMKKLEA